MAINSTDSTFFVARQPILDRNGNICAYELLYRNSGINAAASIPKNATQQVVTNALNMAGLGNLIDKGTQAFINIDERLLFSDILYSIPKEYFILEILETVELTDSVITRVRKLHDEGYTFALDDLICSNEIVNDLIPVLPYVKIIKLEPSDNPDILRPFIALFKKMGITVLAEKVETKEEYETYHNLGCDLFQGYFFARPTLISGNKIHSKVAHVFHAITLVNQDRIEEALELFAQDAALTFQLLRYINSAAFSFRSDIKTTRQAFSLLGTKQLKQWLSLISYAIGSDDGFNSPLLKLAQERANMMWLLTAKCVGEEAAEQAGFIGMISLIDALLQRPMHELLDELNIDQFVKDVLLRSSDSKIGKILELVLVIEEFDNKQMNRIIEELELDFVTFASIIEESYRRSEAFLESINKS